MSARHGSTARRAGSVRSRVALLALSLALGPLAACGWHAGLAAPPGARTVAVTFADNDTRVPELEVEFTDALNRALLDRLDLDLVAGGAADLVIDSRLVDLRRRGGVRDDEARLLESGVTIVVEARLVDGATGAVLSTTRRSVASGFVVGPGLSPATAPGEPLAQDRVLHNLADGVVLDLFAPLAYGDGSGASAAQGTEPGGDGPRAAEGGPAPGDQR